MRLRTYSLDSVLKDSSKPSWLFAMCSKMPNMSNKVQAIENFLKKFDFIDYFIFYNKIN